jgi:hypothetical protein
VPSLRPQPVSVDLTAVVLAVTAEEPRVLVVPAAKAGRAQQASRGQAAAGRPEGLDALPSGPLQLHHRTLDSGLRVWVGEQTQARLGHVEQLYTFGDQDRAHGESGRVLSIGYLALVREAPREQGEASVPETALWRPWYRYFPWEDWRQGKPPVLNQIERLMRRWVQAAPERSERARRSERMSFAFGFEAGAWSDERVLERYELLYEAGLIPEAQRRPAAESEASSIAAEPMAADHRRILATAIARLRGKIKYRPVVFELMPPGFTLLQLQRAVEALAGVRLHKQNFRRLVAQQGLVEETGRIVTATGGRPAREVRFRQEVVLERLAPGVRLSVARGRSLAE